MYAMRANESKKSSSSNDHVACTVPVALYFPSPAPLPMDAEFKNELPQLRY